ncbi:MAG: hypothetical protein M3Q55_15365 [Acidobacteriota bacterium]|nr:hypothetical protein [Acidobacteriota bacterium]
MTTETGAALSVPGRATLSVPGSADAPASDLVAGFRNGFIFELLDTREERPLAVHVMVLNPVRYELTEPHVSTLTAGASNTIVDESYGILQRQIMLEGTFGVSTKKATGFAGAQGSGGALTGHAHFRDLRDMFRRYSALKQRAEDASFICLIFHALRDDDHFILAQPVFSTPRDAKRTRMHYEYRIQAVAIGDAGEISKLRRENAPGLDSLAGLGQDLVDINEALNDARAAFAEVNAVLGQVRRKIGNLQTVMVNAAGLINAVSGTITGVTNIARYPLQLAATVAEQIADAADGIAYALDDATEGTEAHAARSLRRLEVAIDRIGTTQSRLAGDPLAPLAYSYAGERSLTEQDLNDLTAGATIGSRYRATLGSEARAGVDYGSFTGVREVRLTATDSVDSLASRYRVPSEAIIVLNDLREPYFAPGGGPGLRGPGETVIVPIRGTAGTGLSTTEESAEDALYGVDFRLDPELLKDGKLDLIENLTNDPNDAQFVSGLQNVVQGTAITINTEKGTSIFLPDIGIRRCIGRKGTVQHVLLAAINLRDAILADSRIEGIRESRIDLVNDVLTQEITPIVRGRRDGVPMSLPFGRASGG